MFCNTRPLPDKPLTIIFLRTTVHAGEAYGPESIFQAITACYANRIGHGTFLFSKDAIQTKIHKLSGGERNRLLLAKTLKNGGNFIILDEPTNDLDLSTLRVLEEGLVSFKGSVLVVDL